MREEEVAPPKKELEVDWVLRENGREEVEVIRPIARTEEEVVVS